MLIFRTLMFFALIALFCAEAKAQASASVEARPIEIDGWSLKNPYRPYELQSDQGVKTLFYLTSPPTETTGPLIVAVRGSGCDSWFGKSTQGLELDWFHTLYTAIGPAGQILIVEKPGVKTFDRAKVFGTATGCSKDFLQNSKLSTHASNIEAAIRYSIQMRPSAPESVLIVGHSDGAIVAAMIAEHNTKITHVALLAGGGDTQLNDFVSGLKFGKTSASNLPPTNKEIRFAFSQFQSIVTSEDSQAVLYGQPIMRWQETLRCSTKDALIKSTAHVFLSHGTRDASSSIVAYDSLVASLIAVGRQNLTVERIDRADHGFRIGQRSLFMARIEQLIRWLKGEALESTSVVWPLPSSERAVKIIESPRK